MILNALVERLKRWSKDNPKGRCHKGYTQSKPLDYADQTTTPVR
jgi:hypothetical protein